MYEFIYGLWAGFVLSILLYLTFKRNLSNNAIIINIDNLFDLGNIRRRYNILSANSNIKTNLETYMKENYLKSSVILPILLKCLGYQSQKYKLIFYSPDCETLRPYAVQLLAACGLNGNLIMRCKDARLLLSRFKKYNILDII